LGLQIVLDLLFLRLAAAPKFDVALVEKGGIILMIVRVKGEFS
jgi:hypothetical protein